MRRSSTACSGSASTRLRGRPRRPDVGARGVEDRRAGARRRRRRSWRSRISVAGRERRSPSARRRSRARGSLVSTGTTRSLNEPHADGTLPPRPAEALRRGAPRQPRVRDRLEDGARDRRGGPRGPRDGHRARDRRRRREHLPRDGRGGRGDGPRNRRLRGDARHAAQRARAPGRAREARGAHARAVGDHGVRGRGAVHPPPRDPAPGEGPRRDLRGGHREPVLHDGHGRRAARARDRRRGDPHGQERGRGRVRRRPREDPGASSSPS